ncbi:MAG: oligoendopeptidase F [Erysipelotrichaceae bacterium]|nr:oligoendopeptidase F [Erysipelotrichaceae bacterium]
MERKDIKQSEIWDLSLIYQSDEAFAKDLEEAKKLANHLEEQKGHMTDTSNQFYTFLNDYTMLDRLISKLYCFAHLHADVEPSIQNYQYMLSSVLSFNDLVNKKLDFTELEIIHHKDIVLTYLEEDRFAPYRYPVKSILREEAHMLTQEMETLLSKVSPLADTPEQAFNALRLNYGDITVDGQTEPLNGASLSRLLRHKDQNVRRRAYEQFYGKYQEFENVFAATLSGTMKKDAFYADVRKFENPLVASLWKDDVPEELFYKILEKANKQYRPLFHRYNKLKKQLLKVDTLYNYDLFAPLVADVNKSYTIDECFDIILDVVSVFGEDYVNIIKQARAERWIDFHPTTNKRTGAYSSGCYDARPFILMNFIGDYNSLSTMIHELGHSCHTYLSCKYQHPATSDYRIFVAEVASTVNETLLINYMLEHAQTDEEKAYFLYEFLENCVGLIFRQPMYAEFEDELHHWAQNNEPMNASRITQLYDQLNDDYYGEDVVNDQYVGHSCFYIPHFYYNYYVYKYTLGMTVALAIVARILKGDQQQVADYLSFLSSGGSMSPLQLLEKAGVNPLEDAIYDDAFQYFESLLNEFEAIMLHQ